jgi:Zn-dependent membrane protease YugP
MPYFFYMDYWYIVLVIPAVIFTMIAQFMVSSTFNKYSKLISRRGLTGMEAARKILDANGLHHVAIERIRGSMTDHFDPRTNVICLSETVYDVSSVAAVGVAAHEAGHAIQYAKEYAPIKLRAAIIPVTRIGSMLAMPLFIIGLILASDALLLFGIALYSLVTLFQLVTLPVEFNASRRAMKALEATGYYTDEELDGARRVLRAAAMTYVAALAVSLLQILRLVILSNNRRR